MFDTMTFTKTLGAVCGSLLVFLLIGWAGSALFYTGGGHGGEAEEQAYLIDTGEGEATDEAADAGPAFDPLGASRGPLPRTLQEAEPGGLGLLLVHRFMDERSYQRAGDRNVLKLGIYFSKDP
jgi:hypothetical protein